MTYEQLVKAINKYESGIIINAIQKVELERLMNEHNSKTISLWSSLKVISKQLKLGMSDIYDRFYLARTKLSLRDSASKLSYQIRYGEFWEPLYNEKVKKTTPTLELYINKYGEELGTIKYTEVSKSKSISLENCIRRYGEVEGTIFYDTYWKNTTFGKSEEKFILKYGDVDGKVKFKEYNDSLKGRGSLQYYIDRYGEDYGTEFYNTTNTKRNLASTKKVLVEAMLEQGCSFNEIQDEISRRWCNTSLAGFISKYGEVEGNKRYEDYLVKQRYVNPLCLEFYTSKNIPYDIAVDMMCEVQKIRQSRIKRSSKIAYKILFPIAKMFVDLRLCTGYNISCENNSEFSIKLTELEHTISTNRIYFYDLYLNQLKIIIEYHGERYHDTHVDYDSTKTLTYDYFIENYNKDLFKKFIAEQRGYDVYVIREWELKSDLGLLYKNFNEKYLIGEKWMHLFV